MTNREFGQQIGGYRFVGRLTDIFDHVAKVNQDDILKASLEVDTT